MRCMACGAESKPGDKFCEACGAPLQQATGPQVDQPAGQPAVAAGGQTQQWQGAGYVPPDATAYQASPYAPAVPQPPQGSQASGAPFVLAIIALVTALLGLFPVSLVLAIIALAMNSGQKKRGEASTKQTPTFVMGLISLILSILMAIATLVLGGAVWLAIVNGDLDIDLDDDGASIVTPQSARGSDAVGVWKVVSLTDGEDTIDEEYLKLMEDMGVTFELVLAEDGTASLELFDESEKGTWEDRGSGKVAVTFDGDTAAGTIEGDELTITYDNDALVFHRSADAASATAGAATGDSGSQSSSSSASASTESTFGSSAPSDSAAASSASAAASA